MTTVAASPCDEAIMRSHTGDGRCSSEAAPWVLAATILGSSITFIDGTVVNVALPALQRSLGANIAGIQWIVESYALMLSALILVGGSLGDRFGRRRIFSIGIIIFAAASAACSISQNVGQLIAARAVQGVGAAMLVPGSLAIISGIIFSRGPRPCHRNLVGLYSYCRRHRADIWRMADRAVLMALDIPHKPAPRRCSSGDNLVACTRKP